MTVDSFGDYDLASVAEQGDLAEIAPLVEYTVRARVTDAKGNTVSGFSGPAMIELYDGGQNLLSFSQDGSSYKDPLNIRLDEYILATKECEAVDGVITATIAVPAPRFPFDTNRLVVTATDTRTRTYAAGMNDNMSVSDGTDTTPDPALSNAVPEIKAMYLESESRSEGDPVGTSTVLYVDIDPSIADLDYSSNRLGASSTLTLDGTTRQPDFLAHGSRSSDGMVHIVYPIAGLTEGLHSLEAVVRNIAGNSARRTIDFLVLPSTIEAQLVVLSDIAKGGVVFEIEHTSDHANTDVTLFITDSHGRQVFRVDHVAETYEWNLKGSDGRMVEDGRYQAYITVANPLGSGFSRRVTFDVIK